MNSFSNQINNELSEAEENLKESSENISNKEAEIIHSLPEKERLAVYKAMQSDAKQNGAYSAYLDAKYVFRLLFKAFIIVAIIVLIVRFGFSDAWKYICEIFSELNGVY